MEGDDKEWQEYMGKDVMIKRISPGDGTIAEMKSIVKANIKVYLMTRDKEDKEEQSDAGITLRLVNDMREVSFQIGEGDAVPGLELALRHSSAGEKLRVRTTHKFAYGAAVVPAPAGGGRDIPAFSDLEFEVEVLEHADLEGPGPELVRLDIATRKEAGNRWFAAADFLRAGRCFTKGAQAAEKNLASLATPPPAEGQTQTQTPLYISVAQLYLDCLNNLAACHLSLKDPFKAREACIKVLEADPNNMRGLLRAGKASLGLHEYSESRLCFASLLELQQAALARAQEAEEVDEVGKATADVKTTEMWLKKLKKAESDYKNRDKSIGKRISKGLFEGKDEIIVAKEKESVSSDQKVERPREEEEVEGKKTGMLPGDSDSGGSSSSSSSSMKFEDMSAGESPVAETNLSAISNTETVLRDKETEASNITRTDTSSAAPPRPVAGAGAVHPLVQSLHTYQLYFYSAVLVASVAVGLQIL